MMLSRRHLLATFPLAGLAAAMAPSPAAAQSGLTPDLGIDLTDALQSAIDTTVSGRLDLPAGRFLTRTLRLPSGFALTGVPGATQLVLVGSGPILLIAGCDQLQISGLGFDGRNAGGDLWHGGLVHVTESTGITLRDCTIGSTQLNGVSLLRSAAHIENCEVSGCEQTGIFAHDSNGVTVVGNRIHTCANGGVRIWRSDRGNDGSIVLANLIWNIDWTNGGNGQNGNGVNIFRADGVIVSDNYIADCSFSAVRLNATNNCQIRGNTCLNSGEVAIFSEFEFSGSVIASNIVDGAAAGISMTNYNDGGRLAVCTGNIVRNIAPASSTNPDTWPYGIAAEADAIVSSNIVESVPGIGILAGWGPYLRDVTISGNFIRHADVAIAVSVAEGAGRAVISGNTISGARRHALSANRWHEVASNDLAADAASFPNLVVRNNSVLE